MYVTQKDIGFKSINNGRQYQYTAARPMNIEKDLKHRVVKIALDMSVFVFFNRWVQCFVAVVY